MSGEAAKGVWFHTRMSPGFGVGIVEVWFEDQFVATICPAADRGTAALSVVSQYLEEVVETPDPETVPHVALYFNLDEA